MARELAMERACSVCGLMVKLHTDNWARDSNGIRHTSCHFSREMARLPETTTQKGRGRPPAGTGEGASLLTQAEAANLMHVNRRTIHRLIVAGHLPAKRLRGSRSVLIQRADLMALLEDYPVRDTSKGEATGA